MIKYTNLMVMGAGAVGAYFGGCIANRTETNVSLIARGAHLQAIQDKGLRIRGTNTDTIIRVDAYDDPAKAPEPDLVFFTVKSYDTEAAINVIKPAVTDQTQILTIQNGIENYPKLVQAFGRDRVIQGFCKIGAGVSRPGVIEHKAFGKLTVGEKNGSTSARLKALQQLCANAAIPLHVTSEIDRKVWLKFIWNCVFNMLTAVADVTVEKLFEHKKTQQLCYSLFEEIQMVAKAEGVSLTKADAENIIEPARNLVGFQTSTYQDRQKEKRLEFEAFTGAIVRLAEKYGLAVPHNETIYALLKIIDSEG